jgi:hypothetical protein
LSRQQNCVPTAQYVPDEHRMPGSEPLALQETETAVTFAPASVPVALATPHVWAAGWVETVTAYALRSASGVANVNVPLVVRVSGSTPLSLSTSVPESPLIVPPIVKKPGALSGGPPSDPGPPPVHWFVWPAE